MRTNRPVHAVLLCASCILHAANGEERDEDAAEEAEEEEECGSGPFERCGFFYDTLPWWHLITPLVVSEFEGGGGRGVKSTNPLDTSSLASQPQSSSSCPCST